MTAGSSSQPGGHSLGSVALELRDDVGVRVQGQANLGVAECLHHHPGLDTLWGVFPEGLILQPACHNLRPDHALDCCCRDHVAAPRGSRTGTQGGVSTEEAGRIPRDLAERFREAVERDRGTTLTGQRVGVIGATRATSIAVASVSR